MNALKRILTRPIKNTLITIIVSMLIYIILGILFLYLNNIASYDFISGGGSHRYSILQNIGITFANDMYVLSRIALELSLIMLIAQLIYRATRRRV